MPHSFYVVFSSAVRAGRVRRFSGPFHLGKIDHDNKAVQIYSQYVLCD